MNFRLLLLTTIFFKIVSARYGGSRQKFFGLDSAVIVDADKSLLSSKVQPQNRNQQYFRRLHYPFYQIIPRNQHLPQSTDAPLTTTSTTTTTPATIYTKDEFPADLLDMAQNKLGIKSLEEIPSISELGDLLGTQNAEETIKYMRELTATENGIALVKAYIESSDYTDSSGSKESSVSTSTVESIPSDSSSVEDIIEPGFFKRMSNYLNFFEFFAKTAATSKEEDEASSLQKLDRITSHGKQQQPLATGNMIRFKAHTPNKPLLVRNPLPYHYPIPIRPLVLYHPKGAAMHAEGIPFKTIQSVVHLNTPKMLVPPIQITREVTQPPTRRITTPKQQHQFDDLAARVSKFPLTHNRDALIDTQYLAAIEKAFAEDEDLKKILGSTETLK